MTTRISVAQSLRVYSASSTIHHPDGPSGDERRSSGDHVVVEREKIRFSSCGWRASEFPERRLRADDVVYTTGKRTHTHKRNCTGVQTLPGVGQPSGLSPLLHGRRLDSPSTPWDFRADSRAKSNNWAQSGRRERTRRLS